MSLVTHDVARLGLLGDPVVGHVGPGVDDLALDQRRGGIWMKLLETTKDLRP
jgi:hypothetical protein